MFLTPGVRNLLIANIALLAVPYFLGQLEVFQEALGLHSLYSHQFAAYQLLGHMFMHHDFWHLFFNMLGLAFFGSWLERYWGLRRFLAFYFICGIGAGLLYLGINYFEITSLLSDKSAFIRNPDADGLITFIQAHFSQASRGIQQFADAYAQNPENSLYRKEAVSIVTRIADGQIDVPLIGASGAVYGIMMAFALIFPNMEMLVFPLPIPIKAKYVVLFAGITALFGAIHPTPGDNVAHYAHIGGMLFGFLMVRLYQRYPV